MGKKKKKEVTDEALEVDSLEEVVDEEIEDVDSENEVEEEAVDEAPVEQILSQPLHEIYGENPPLHILNKFS
jgi:hypothetical protein